MARPSLGSLPLNPLIKAAGLRSVLNRMGWHEDRWTDADCSMAILSEFVGCSRITVGRWGRQGVPVSVADEVACALGLNPVEVWGDEWWRP